MRTILIVTTGTRDVQIKKSASFNQYEKKFIYRTSQGEARSIQVFYQEDFPEVLFLSSVREGCLRLYEDFEHVKHDILFPMIDAAVKFVLKEKSSIDVIVFIVTDQEGSGAEEKHVKRDTVNLPPLAEKFLCENYAESIKDYHSYKVTEKLTDIDFWFDRFDEEVRNKNIYPDPEEEASIYFLPQGGIDQINQALTLKLIENYPQLKLIQISEGKEPRILDFPRKFIQNITRLKAVEMAKHFRFAQVGLLNFAKDREIEMLSNLGKVLMQLDYSTLKDLADRNDYIRLSEKVNTVRNIFDLWAHDEDSRNILLYLTAKVHYYNKSAEEMLWRLFTLYEQLIKARVADLLEWHNDDSYAFFEAIRLNEKLYNHLIDRFNGKIEPRRHVYEAILCFFNENINDIRPIQILRERRNELLHSGLGLSMEKVNKLLEQHKINLDNLFENRLDRRFGVSGFGLLGELRDEILKRLGVV